MILRISDKFLRQTSQRNYFCFLPAQKHVTKSSCAYHTVCFHRQKEKTYRDYTVVNNNAWKTMSHAPISLCTIVQIRNLSNEINTPKNVNIEQNEQLLDAQSVISPEETIDTMMTYLPSFLKNASNWKIVELAQETLLKVHEITGLHWWASIALTALLSRTFVTLPFSIITVHNMAKYRKVHTEMDEVVKRLKKNANYACQFLHWPEDLARKEFTKALMKERKAMIIRENCHPAKNIILLWIQLPLWFSFSLATRNLCYMLPKPDYAAQITFMEMSVGGFEWFSNLAIPDPYMVLPITLGLMNLANIEAHRLFRTEPTRKIDWWLTNFSRLISLILIPIASYLPAATNVYWLTSSTFSLMQTFILQSPKLRRTCGMPVVKSDEHPYRNFYSNLKSKLAR